MVIARAGTAGLVLRITPVSDPMPRVLERAAIAEDADRHGRRSESPVPSDVLGPPSGLLLVGWIDDDLVGCGGWRWVSAGLAELKRLYVVRDVRRRGVATAILKAVEASAVAAGAQRLRADCGTG
jgi:GNAT superfamily N-acetyltransferase